MDSGVLLADSVENYELLRAVTFDYGAKHSGREIACATALSTRYGIPQTIIPLSFFNDSLSSSLLKSGDSVPEGTYNETNMRSTVVPFRNGIMLAAAVALAENDSLDTVLIASHAGDRAVYPDCRAEFTDAFSLAASLGTYAQVKVSAPFHKMSKRDIAELGKKIDFDFTLTWTCYNGGEIHCGKCAACHERRSALTSVFGTDPTKYRA